MIDISSVSFSVLAIIMAGGFVAGFVDSIAGGGGLVSLPVLLAVGLPPHAAIGTNKFAATFGAIMSAWQFYRAKKVDVSLMIKAIPFTVVGAVGGCFLMLYLSSQWLKPIIIAALMGTAVFVTWHRALGTMNTYERETRSVLIKTAAIALTIGFYDGFMGPGTGTFLIVSFATLGFDFILAAGNAKILNMVSNLTAFVLFIYWGQVLYLYGIAMAVCIFLGAFFGSRLAIAKGSAFVRYIMLAVTGILILKLLSDYLGG